MADHDTPGLGPGVAQAQRGPLQVRRRPRSSQAGLQVGAGGQDRGEIGGVGVVLEDPLALGQQPPRLRQPPQPDQRPRVIEPDPVTW